MAAHTLHYVPVFHAPEGDIPVRWLPDEYYAAAHAVLEDGLTRPPEDNVEGLAAVFLFRHYLELSLKWIVFYLRRLAWKGVHFEVNETAELPEGHHLDRLWDELKREFRSKIGAETWADIDADFIFMDQCVKEFQAADPNSERFRYWFSILKRSTGTREHWPEVEVDRTALFFVMGRANIILTRIGAEVNDRMPAPF